MKRPAKSNLTLWMGFRSHLHPRRCCSRQSKRFARRTVRIGCILNTAWRNKDEKIARSNWAMKREVVESSAVDRVGYDEKRHILEIEYKGGHVYHYFDVPSK